MVIASMMIIMIIAFFVEKRTIPYSFFFEKHNIKQNPYVWSALIVTFSTPVSIIIFIFYSKNISVEWDTDPCPNTSMLVWEPKPKKNCKKPQQSQKTCLFSKNFSLFCEFRQTLAFCEFCWNFAFFHGFRKISVLFVSFTKV
jgi:hypothetical protein